MLEKHILVNGEVRTIWGEDSPVEAAIKRESVDLCTEILRLRAENTDLSNQNSCLRERLQWAELVLAAYGFEAPVR